MARWRETALLATVVVVATSCGAPSESALPTAASAPVAILPPLPEPIAGDGEWSDAATVVQAVQPRWNPGAEGLGMTDEFREHPFVLEPPVPVSVLSGPVAVDGEDWYEIYVLPDPMRGPTDFVAWIPAELDGAPVVRLEGSRHCPDSAVANLARLTPKGRADCFGDRSIEVAARSWLAGNWVIHRTEPEWLAGFDGEIRSISLYELGEGAFPRPPNPDAAWIDVRVPPDVDMPPIGMTLLVEGQFEHPDALGCRRTVDRMGLPAAGGVPDEDRAASAAWCRGQFVVSSWEVLLGPEDRPLVAGEAQLHRTPFEGGACGGVGMPPMRFRMDAREIDPIWLEADGWTRRIIPVFGRGFRVVTQPELTVIGPRGDVVARDGTPLDPDANLGAYPVCPGGDTVVITAS